MEEQQTSPVKQSHLYDDIETIAASFQERAEGIAENPVVLLSLDGGGVRGLVLIEMLIALRDKFRQECGDPKAEIRDMVDLVCGTSTGGILAFALQQGIPLERLRDIYVNFPKSIFTGSWHGKFFKALLWVNEVSSLLTEYKKTNNESSRPHAMRRNTDWSLQGARYSNDGLKHLINQHLGGTLALTDEAIRSHPKAFCVAKRKGTLGWSIFCNYGEKNEIPSTICKRVSVCQALLATSAAPTYFPSVSIEVIPGQELCYEDGGIGYNNPIRLGLRELNKMPGARGRKLVIVSLGTGHQRTLSKPCPRLLYLLRLASDIRLCATESQKTHEDMKRDIKQNELLTYFRLNPRPPTNDPDSIFLGDIPLDSCSDKDILLMQQGTNHYLERKAGKLTKIVAAIGNRQEEKHL